jgi:hypothetical protein
VRGGEAAAEGGVGGGGGGTTQQQDASGVQAAGHSGEGRRGERVRARGGGVPTQNGWSNFTMV